MKVKPGRFIVIAAILTLLAFGFYSAGNVIFAEKPNFTSGSGYEENDDEVEEEEVEEETQDEVPADEEENTASASGYEAESDIIAAAVLGTVDRQDVTPGTQQTGHMNIDGTGLFGKVGVSGDSGTSGLTGVDMEHTGTNPRKWRVGAQGSQLKGSFAITDITTSEANPKYRLTINKFGKVGIGTKRPKEKLHVNGNVKANSFIGDGSLLTGISITETDPVFGASPAAGITAPQIANWNTAYSWGDHTIPGYLTGYTETDPVFGASPASGIAAPQISNWNTAYGWGNHAVAGYLTGYIESDPQVGANTLNYVPKWDGDELVTGTIYDDGKVGIGDITPEFKLSLDNDGGIIAKGTYGSGAALSTSGAGTRMIWYPKKAAFRAGRVTNNSWDDASIGDYSIAMGYKTRASGISSTAMGVASSATGPNSTAMGTTTWAKGTRSTAMGLLTEAAGTNSTAMGNNTDAWGDSSTAMGYDTRASGSSSTAMGFMTTASGPVSTAMGYYATASGSRSTAMGSATASGDFSTAMGWGTAAESYVETVIGGFDTIYIPSSATTWDTNDRLFVIGNGTSTATRSTAMTVLKNGDIGIGTDNPTDILHVKSPAGADTGLVLDTTDSTGIGRDSFIDFNTAGVLSYGIGPDGANGDTISIYGSDSIIKFTLNQDGWLGLGSNVLPTQPLIVSSGAHVTSGGVWTDASSRDYKENIHDLTIEDAKTALDELRPKRYNYKVDKEDECLGFIAEDVPELVASKDRKSLSPMDIVAVLTKVVQTQQKEIEELKAVNETARNENEQLKENLLAMGSRLEALETMFLAVSTTLTKEKLAKLE